MQRGAFTPRRARGGSHAPAAQTTGGLPPDRDIMEGLLQDAIEILRVPDDAAVSDNAVDVTIDDADVQCIGSYNWLEESTPSTPVILVPGSPPEWQNKSTPFKVPVDEEPMFVDQNGFRMPKTTLLPLMAAVDIVTDSPPFDWSTADFVTDRNGLRKLLRWITYARSPTVKNQKEFRIDTQLAGHTTVLLNRWEKRYQEKPSGYTFGFNFEKESTTPAAGCKSSTGHHRIVTYDFAGRRMVVRFEVDACLPHEGDIDALADALSSTSLTDSPETTTIKGLGSPHQTLTVKRGGSLVPQNAILELSTVTVKRVDSYDWAERLPQLYISNTPQHFLSIHERGQFLRTEKQRTVNMEKGELMQDLARLWHVLGTIQEIVVDHGEKGRLTLVRNESEIKVYARESMEGCLPAAYIKKFEI